MDILSTSKSIGITKVVENAFISVFQDANVMTEAWLQKSKLMTIGRSKFSDYIQKSVGTFPLFGTNRNVPVDSIYVRVRITSDLEKERYKSHVEIENSLKKQKRGEVPDKNRFSRGCNLYNALEGTKEGIALLGNAGSGKTTAFRRLVVDLARGLTIRGKRRLPLYIAIRDISTSKKSIKESAAEFLKWMEVGSAELVLEKLMKKGSIVLFVDGLDETDREHQNDIIKELIDIRNKFRDVILLISSRPYSLYVGLPGFEKWETLPLDFQERLSFIEKWFAPIDPTKSKRLINEAKNNSALLDLSSNPLMLSIVCALYHNDLNIPSEPDELYARTVEGLLGAWDAFRNIARETVLNKLSLRKRIILVGWIAASMFEKQKFVFSPDDIESEGCLDRASEMMRTEIPQANLILKSLFNDFGLLVERAPNLYSFSHLTLHEFLVAQYIIDNRREIYLGKKYRTIEWWHEIIKLVAKMLPNADEYMTILTKETHLNDLYEISLLENAWSLKPICSPEVVKNLMNMLITKFLNAVQKLPIKYKLEGTQLIIKPSFSDYDFEVKGKSSFRLSKSGRRKMKRFNENPMCLNILTNFSHISRIFESMSVDLGAFCNTKSSLINTLIFSKNRVIDSVIFDASSKEFVDKMKQKFPWRLK